MRRFFLLIIALFLVVAPAEASESPALSGHPHDLLQRSLKTSSFAQRGIIRAYLAKNHPDTPEGLFCAGWIAGVEGRNDDRISLYRKAIEADPELTVAYINLALALESSGRNEEAIGVYDTALQTAPFDVDLVRNGFFLRKTARADKAGAARFLDEWQGKVGNLDYGFDFVRALDAEADGRYADAERLYQSAVGKDAPFAVYEKLASLRLTKLSDDKMSPAERITFVSQVLESMLQGEGNADAYLFVGRMLRDRLKAGRYSIDYFSKAFDIEPTAEAAGEAFTQMAIYDFAAAREFLEKANKVLPDNYSLKNDLAWMHYQFLAEPEHAARVALEAFKLAPHDLARLDAIRSFSLSQQAYGRFGEAHAFIVEKLRQEWSPETRRKLLILAAENSIAAQEFSQAKIYIDTVALTRDHDAAWVAGKSALVSQALALQAGAVAESVAAPSPAIPPILFAVNSDVIPASGRDALDRLARDIQQQGDAAAVLSIEGYADSTGRFKTNEALSYRRAKAVENYLLDHHAVAPQKLKIAAHGARHPDASNLSPQGRRQNRRVEIWPTKPDADSPKAAAIKGNAFSPDGRHAVFGQNPPQVWDTRTDHSVAQLYRGRSFRFSPDGRYVAATSSYTEESGKTTEAVYVYGAASGQAVAQIHEPLEVVEFAWRPDSGGIVFSTADGFLKTYDLATRRYNVTRMGTTRIGGPLAWFPDGRTIAGGQHRGGELVLWDAATLKPLRRLDGVKWPHAIGVSPDGRHLLAFDNRLTMSVWDIAKGGKPRQTEVPMIPLDLQFHPERPWVVFNAKFEASKISLAVMDYMRMNEVAQWASNGTYAVGISRDGGTVTAISGSREMSLDTGTLQISKGRERR